MKYWLVKVPGSLEWLIVILIQACCITPIYTLLTLSKLKLMVTRLMIRLMIKFQLLVTRLMKRNSKSYSTRLMVKFWSWHSMAFWNSRCRLGKKKNPPKDVVICNMPPKRKVQKVVSQPPLFKDVHFQFQHEPRYKHNSPPKKNKLYTDQKLPQ